MRGLIRTGGGGAIPQTTDSAGDPAVNVVVADLPVQPGDNTTEDVKEVVDGYEYEYMTATDAVKAGTGWVAGFILISGTSPTLILYDDPDSANGNVIYSHSGGSAGDIVIFPKPMRFKTGLYAVLGGTTPIYNVVYI